DSLSRNTTSVVNALLTMNEGAGEDQTNNPDAFYCSSASSVAQVIGGVLRWGRSGDGESAALVNVFLDSIVHPAHPYDTPGHGCVYPPSQTVGVYMPLLLSIQTSDAQMVQTMLSLVPHLPSLFTVCETVGKEHGHRVDGTDKEVFLAPRGSTSAESVCERVARLSGTLLPHLLDLYQSAGPTDWSRRHAFLRVLHVFPACFSLHALSAGGASSLPSLGSCTTPPPYESLLLSMVCSGQRRLAMLAGVCIVAYSRAHTATRPCDNSLSHFIKACLSGEEKDVLAYVRYTLPAILLSLTGDSSPSTLRRVWETLPQLLRPVVSDCIRQTVCRAICLLCIWHSTPSLNPVMHAAKACRQLIRQLLGKIVREAECEPNQGQGQQGRLLLWASAARRLLILKECVSSINNPYALTPSPYCAAHDRRLALMETGVWREVRESGSYLPVENTANADTNVYTQALRMTSPLTPSVAMVSNKLQTLNKGVRVVSGQNNPVFKTSRHLPFQPWFYAAPLLCPYTHHMGVGVDAPLPDGFGIVDHMAQRVYASESFLQSIQSSSLLSQDYDYAMPEADKPRKERGTSSDRSRRGSETPRSSSSASSSHKLEGSASMGPRARASRPVVRSRAHSTTESGPTSARGHGLSRSVSKPVRSSGSGKPRTSTGTKTSTTRTSTSAKRGTSAKGPQPLPLTRSRSRDSRPPKSGGSTSMPPLTRSTSSALPLSSMGMGLGLKPRFGRQSAERGGGRDRERSSRGCMSARGSLALPKSNL
ncbi:hypothetical protein KIPB_009303, partial [Kipferlia bialata]